jgi:hypothetical protein
MEWKEHEDSDFTNRHRQTETHGSKTCSDTDRAGAKLDGKRKTNAEEKMK